ncbi:phosphodiesterase [Posidoniimonas polymericola]|uniref:Phosphoesterase n=1 Tax=Posidoniimonas polymericola TaxID=2528002 RepID=A0A5C5YG32_9BACT|nr:metallophosphoesterase [Posidoniimonas polymericola]TWT73451.1 phosphodiesterase [Posidoniimonas polymericola]
MKIGVISDTHGHVDLTQAAVRMLQSLDVEVVLHCGDIGGPDVVRQFHHWPTHFVAGNCDYDLDALGAAVRAENQHWHDQFGELTIDGLKIALLHSHDRKAFRKACRSGDYDLVCYGHTHIAAVEESDSTLVLNPGAVYRANPHSVAIVETAPLAATVIPL